MSLPTQKRAGWHPPKHHQPQLQSIQATLPGNLHRELHVVARAQTGHRPVIDRFIQINVAVADLEIEPTARIRAHPGLKMDGSSLIAEV